MPAERRDERVGKNQALFRDVNERVAALGATAPDPDLIGILCECGDETCVSEVRMSLAAYERLREDPARFAVLHGHEVPALERVVERTDAYLVIEKRPGRPLGIARRTDDRS